MLSATMGIVLVLFLAGSLGFLISLYQSSQKYNGMFLECPGLLLFYFLLISEEHQDCLLSLIVNSWSSSSFP